MGMVRHYSLEARSGDDAALLLSLGALVEALRQVDGFEGADLWQDAERPGIYIFHERWRSREAHQASAGHLPKPVMAALMQALAGPPQARCLVAATLPD